MKKTAALSTLLFALPFVAAAQQLTQLRTFVASIGGLLGQLIPILIAATVVIFFWGLFNYVRKSGKKAENGKKVLIAGIVALFVEVSLWGIIIFAQQSLGIGGIQGGINPPVVNGIQY